MYKLKTCLHQPIYREFHGRRKFSINWGSIWYTRILTSFEIFLEQCFGICICVCLCCCIVANLSRVVHSIFAIKKIDKTHRRSWSFRLVNNRRSMIKNAYFVNPLTSWRASRCDPFVGDEIVSRCTWRHRDHNNTERKKISVP